MSESVMVLLLLVLVPLPSLLLVRSVPRRMHMVSFSRRPAVAIQQLLHVITCTCQMRCPAA